MGFASDALLVAEQCTAEIEGNAPTVAALLGILKRHGFGGTNDPAALSGSFDIGSVTLHRALIDEGWEVSGNDRVFTATDTEGTQIAYRDEEIFRA
jgi:hypothetical protein